MREEYKRKDCTHVLSCRHCLGCNRFEYTMDCIPLKEMNDERIKVLVFGDRYWKGSREKKYIRYVKSWRVKGKRPPQKELKRGSNQKDENLYKQHIR